jgi:hypothetical protein
MVDRDVGSDIRAPHRMLCCQYRHSIDTNDVKWGIRWHCVHQNAAMSTPLLGCRNLTCMSVQTVFYPPGDFFRSVPTLVVLAENSATNELTIAQIDGM